MYTLTIQPYYDNYLQQYTNIIRINMIPEGPLRLLVKNITLPSLSSFDYYNRNYVNNKCAFVITSLCGNRYMSPNDIPDLFSFLSNNGYKIDTSITKMINTGEVRIDNQNILCFFSFIGKDNIIIK